MIGRITGCLLEKKAPYILVDVAGVGYEIQVPMTTYCALPALASQVELATHHAVSEVSTQLFGFATRRDRDFFRLLIKVNGVGPKMAVGIMSLDVVEIARHIHQDNVTALTKVPGVGKKTGERLIIEMRDKIKSLNIGGVAMESDDLLGAKSLGIADQDAIVADAEAALVALGYKPADATKTIAKIIVGMSDRENLRSEDLIRLALKSMLPA